MNNLFSWIWTKKEEVGSVESKYSYKALVTHVYDGDTITVDIEILNTDLGFDLSIDLKMKRQKLRLLGINAPEITGKSKQKGIESRDWLAELILWKEITFDSTKDKKGKYGRWLATITHIGGLKLKETVNEELVRRGLAKEANY